jgi:hypothetical protein
LHNRGLAPPITQRKEKITVNVFTYKVEKDNTGFGWNGNTPAYEDISPSCIIPTDCIKKARAFVKKWALKNGFVALGGNFVSSKNQFIKIATNF